jgi:hypothetical protein
MPLYYYYPQLTMIEYIIILAKKDVKIKYLYITLM